MKKKKANVSFDKWLKLELKYGNMLPWAIEMAALIAIAFMICIGTCDLWWPPFLFLGVSAAFGLALLWRWQKALEHPPWYLKGEKDDGRN